MPPQIPESQFQPQSSQNDPTVTLPRPDQPQEPRMSRRSLLRGAAIGGAAGIVVAGGAGAVAEYVRPSQSGLDSSPAAKPVVMAPMAPSALSGPLVVYLHDTASGQLDVFAGEGQTRLHDPALVARLLKSLK